MTTSRTIQVIGLSHHTAPVEVREALAFPRARLPEALASMRAAEGVEEVVILCTCNRVEVYVCARSAQSAALVKDLLTNFHGLKAASFERHLYTCEGMDAVAHLFRVAAGLDSMVLGEAQVTAQVKAAYELAAAERTVGRVFHRLFQHSLSVAKRVRTCSEIDSGRASVGSVAVQLAQRIFETLADRTVLLIGAGQIGEVVLRSLRTAGAATTLVANRTFSRAEALARDCGGSAVRFDQLPANLARADIVISSTDAPHYVIRRSDVESALRERRGRPIFLIDIAVPRNIEPVAAELEGCYLYNVDDLQMVVEETISRRKQDLNLCLATVDEETEKFMRWVRGLEVAPTIVELRDSLHELKRQELNALLSKYPDLPAAARSEIERTVDRLVNKILHQPIKALQEPSSADHGRGVLAAARRLFGLEQASSRPSPRAPGTSGKGGAMSGLSALSSPGAERPIPVESAPQGLAPAAERTRAAARQLIRLRWLAICGVLGVVVISHKFLHAIEFPITLYLIAAAMAAVNVGFELTSRRLHARPVAAAEHHAYVQIAWDIVSLALLAHFSGGVENPFLLYLVFHVVLASVLMGERQTYIVAVAACAAVMALFLLEGYGVIRHYAVLLPPHAEMARSYQAGICAALTSAFIVTAYLSNSIMRKVRRAETQLLAQNQFLREAEERIRVAGAELSRATDKISELISDAARDQSFDTRYSNPRLEPCWKVLGCAESSCPCHGQPAVRCWQMTGTRCDRESGTFSEKIIRCRSCVVFRRACPDRLTELAEGFNNMMFILGRKAEELKQLRYHALQQERMAAIGQMAAGIAHEVSNPLASLYSLVQVLSSSSAGDAEATARLALMQQSIERISKIVRQIVDFGRPISSEEWLYGNVGKIILDTLHLLSYDRRAQGVEMMADFDPQLPKTMIIEHQLQQVFMNIALNALDAMHGRGKLDVRAGRNNGSIEVVFTDTGEGMTTEEIQHIFEPYYTTKSARLGTGLGLALSYNIIRKHGGTIQVQSEKGKGSTFAVSIPLRGPQGENNATSSDSGR